MDNKKVIEATKALQKYLKDNVEKSDKAQLFEDNDAEPLYLVVTAKRYFGEGKNLRPKLIKVPHSVWPENEKLRICLFSRDPQRAYKDVLYESEEHGPKVVDRVVGLSKLKGKFKRYDARRQLKNDYDLFLTEPEVAPSLPTLLGKVFYGTQAKTPITVTVREEDKIDRDLAVKEIDNILESTVFMKPGSTLVLIRVGLTDSKPKNVAENVKAVVDYLVENVLDEGLKGIRTLSIKTSHSPALPIYYTEKVYDENDIGALEDNDESEAAKRKLEDQHLDELLKEVVDEDEIKEYNREQKRRKRKGAEDAEDAEEDAENDGEEAAENDKDEE